jgi:hypothetical protein
MGTSNIIFQTHKSSKDLYLSQSSTAQFQVCVCVCVRAYT